MSVRCMSWVWEHSPVGGTERLVLLAIADCADDDGANAWPSLATLARKTRLDERTVRRIIRRLEEGGHLIVDVAAGPGGTNRYTVIMTPGQDAPGQIAPPDTALPSPPGHSFAPSPRTQLCPPNVNERPITSNDAPARSRAPEGRSRLGALNPSSADRCDPAPTPPAERRGAALPPPRDVPRCLRPGHVGQPADRCAACRSELLGAH